MVHIILKELILSPCKHVCIAVCTGVSRVPMDRGIIKDVCVSLCPRCLVQPAPQGSLNTFETLSSTDWIQLNGSSIRASVSPLESINRWFTARLMWGSSKCRQPQTWYRWSAILLHTKASCALSSVRVWVHRGVFYHDGRIWSSRSA